MLLLILGILLVEWRLENRLRTALEEQAQVLVVDVSLLLNRLELRELRLDLDESQIEVDAIDLSGFQVFSWLFRDEIRVKILEVSQPRIHLKSGDWDTTTALKPDYLIAVDEISVLHAQVRVMEQETTSFSAGVPKLVLKGVELDQESAESSIPFRFDSYYLQVDSLQTALDPRHDLRLEQFTSDNGNLLAQNLQVVPRYGREAFQNHIEHELDRYDLTVADVGMNGLEIDFVNDSLRIKSTLLRIEQADLEVYRDKLQPDDPAKKLLYSAQLRKLPIYLEVDKVEVLNSHIVYLERVEADREPLEVLFSQVEGAIVNLKNQIQGNEHHDTRINVSAHFMEAAPLQVAWAFNVADPMDNFTISGHFTGLPSEGINRFLTPAMNLKANGGISFLAFNFQGNDHQATGDMELEYQDFSVDVLKEDGSEKRGLLTAIANIFVNNKAKGEDTELTDLEVTRDKSKSFWNFLWLSLREGALKSFL